MYHNGVVVDTSVCQSSSLGSFPGRGRYDLLFNVDMVDLVWGERWNASFCYFHCLECCSFRQVGGGGLGQKVLFGTVLNLVYCMSGIFQSWVGVGGVGVGVGGGGGGWG